MDEHIAQRGIAGSQSQSISGFLREFRSCTLEDADGLAADPFGVGILAQPIVETADSLVCLAGFQADVRVIGIGLEKLLVELQRSLQQRAPQWLHLRNVL